MLAKLIPVVILTTGLLAFFAFDLGQFVRFSTLKENRQWLANWVEDAGYLAVVAYMVIYATMTAFSVPGGAFMSITGGLLFGLWLGCILTVVSATIGAIALFLVVSFSFGQ